ncbi:MAG TPA: NUDIX domain-containing protein [Hydrogenophaga sp.]|uniref:NUDIX hydrolase n=1 Tax=Hydrogenophaga sp. TaxID=1904254 RepID=UPI002D0141A3|nr:NUDIX domain-containing protein [Hydrogenophaga sp.]HMN92221.1 NUDIX domain-containing protein [Hydrogenophaga sp.]HMP11573.1 NUDIX domain-containing protein [Hydrogenophaga sp.]
MSKTFQLKSSTTAATTPVSATAKSHPMPFVRVELVVLSVLEDRLQVLLSRREEAPYQHLWGLPGGVLRIDLDASLEAAARRVAQERLNLALPNLGQVAAVGGADRDPRAPWAMSVVYRSLVQPDLDAKPGKRVQALSWRPVQALDQGEPLAFDHAELVRQAVESVRREIMEMRFPPGWVPDPFTYSELRTLSESILGAPLDKVTFRRRMDASGIALPLDGQMRAGGAHRPAQLYRLASSTKR